MPRLNILLDQNVPRVIASWLKQIKPSWKVKHTSETALDSKEDEEIFNWARYHPRSRMENQNKEKAH